MRPTQKVDAPHYPSFDGRTMSARSELPVPNEKSRPESTLTVAGDAPTPLKPKDSDDTNSIPATATSALPPGATRKGDSLILDWDGPDDPGNPRKCVTTKSFVNNTDESF